MEKDYSEKTIKRFEDPEYVGEIEEPDAVAQEGNPSCGDVLKVFLKIEDNVIKKARFKTYGCIAAIATSDELCEMIEGKTLEEALEITGDKISEELGDLPPVKYHCSLLGTKALKKAIKDYKEKKEED